MNGPPPSPHTRLVLCLAAALSATLLFGALQGTHAGDKKDKTKADAGKKEDKGKKEEKPEPKKEKRVRAKPALELKGHTGFITHVVYNFDGKQLVSSSRDRTVRVWDALTGKELLNLKDYKHEVKSIAISPDGKHLATPTGAFDKKKQTFIGEVRIRETSTGKDVRTLSGHTGTIETVAYSADGKLLATGSEDRTIKVWDPASGKELHTLKGHTDDVLSVAFAPDGKKLASASKDKTVRIWDVANGKELQTLKPKIPMPEVKVKTEEKTKKGAKDNKGAPKDKKGAPKDKKGPKGKKEDKGPTPDLGREITSVAYNADGSRIAAGSLDGTVWVWDDTGKEVQKLKEGEGVWTVAYTRDGKRLAAGGYAETIKVWDVATGKEQLSIYAHERTVTTLAFAPNSPRLASGGVDTIIRIWDLSAIRAKTK